MMKDSQEKASIAVANVHIEKVIQPSNCGGIKGRFFSFCLMDRYSSRLISPRGEHVDIEVVSRWVLKLSPGGCHNVSVLLVKAW